MTAPKFTPDDGPNTMAWWCLVFLGRAIQVVLIVLSAPAWIPILALLAACDEDRPCPKRKARTALRQKQAARAAYEAAGREALRRLRELQGGEP